MCLHLRNGVVLSCSAYFPSALTLPLSLPPPPPPLFPTPAIQPLNPPNKNSHDKIRHAEHKAKSKGETLPASEDSTKAGGAGRELPSDGPVKAMWEMAEMDCRAARYRDVLCDELEREDLLGKVKVSYMFVIEIRGGRGGDGRKDEGGGEIGTKSMVNIYEWRHLNRYIVGGGGGITRRYRAP